MKKVKLKEHLEKILMEKQRALDLEFREVSRLRESTETRLKALEAFSSNLTGRLWAYGTMFAVGVTLILKLWR